MEIKAGEIRMAETERGRSKEKSRKEAIRKRKGEGEKKEKIEKRKNNRNKKSSRRMGNLGWGRRSSKVRSGGEKVGSRKVSPVDKNLWQKTVRENAYIKNLRSHNRHEGRVCAKEGKGISIVKERKRRSERVYQGTIEERVYLTLKVTSNSASILCRKERW